MLDCDQFVPNSGSLQLTRAYVERVLDGYPVPVYTPAKPHSLPPAAQAAHWGGLRCDHELLVLVSPTLEGSYEGRVLEDSQ